MCLSVKRDSGSFASLVLAHRDHPVGLHPNGFQDRLVILAYGSCTLAYAIVNIFRKMPLQASIYASIYECVRLAGSDEDRFAKCACAFTKYMPPYY